MVEFNSRCFQQVFHHIVVFSLHGKKHSSPLIHLERERKSKLASIANYEKYNIISMLEHFKNNTVKKIISGNYF